jgi:hypothetical protein
VLVSGSETSDTERKFNATLSGTIKNAKEIICATARESWGKLPYWFLATSSDKSSGSSAIILSGDLTGTIATTGVAAETVPVFYESDLQLSIDVDLNATAN